jgi:hypothetical protein
LIPVWEILLAVVGNVQSLRKSALYDKRDDFTFPIVDFLFISNNIPASPAYVVYILHFIRYSRVCAQYSDFLDRAQLLMQKLLKQGYVAPRLKSLLQKLYGHHHNLVDRYEISISQMTMDLLLYVDFFFLLSLPRLLPD